MYPIVKKEKLADKIYLMDVEAPRVARACQPGEFVIVKMDEVGERIPLTICDFDREKGLVTIVFQIVGASTMRMAELKAGDYFQDFVGPLGQPSEFVKEDLEEVKKRKYLFVAGGVGSAPVVVSSVGSLLALASCSPCSVFVPVRFPFCLAPVFSVLRSRGFSFSFARCSSAWVPFGSPALRSVVASWLACWGV